MTVTATGRATTTRAPRYLKQLLSHLGEKIDTETTEDGVGLIRYHDVTATLTPTDDTLEFALTGSEAETLYRAMWIIERHLEKFGLKDGLTCQWDGAELAADYQAVRAVMAEERRLAKEAEAAARD